MLKQISMRIPEETYGIIEKLSKLEKTEKSAVIREALEKGLNKIKKDVAIELYRENELSISEAASLADVSVPEIMEVLMQHGIKSKMTIKDLEEGKKTAEEII